MASLVDVLFPVLMLAWLAGVLVLGLRANAKGKVYLRRLPPVNGIPLDVYMYSEKDWLRGWHGPVWQAYRQQQANPELEHLRQEARQRSRYVMLWIFGFPALVAGVMMLLIGSGAVH